MRALAALLLLAVPALAGCGDTPTPRDVPLEPGRAVLAGVVVDQAIRPLGGVRIDVTDAGLEATTDDDGAFQLPVPVGAHLLELSHPAFALLRQEVDVPATGVRGLVLRFTATAAEAPYSTVAKYEGFIVCSLGLSVVFSEECGEGVGTPLGRFGKQDNNAIRYDFQPESPSLKSVVLDMTWEPTSEAGRELLVLFATNWTCDPACDGDRIGTAQGPAPLLLRSDAEALSTRLQDPAVVFSTYTLARNDVSQANVVLNQRFQLFVSQFYREGAPDGYSFIASAGA